MNNKIREILMFYIQFFIPSSTLFYIIIHDLFGQGIVLSSYIVANVVGATIMYPVNLYIFRGRFNKELK